MPSLAGPEGLAGSIRHQILKVGGTIMGNVMQTNVVGLFAQEQTAQAVVDQLVGLGIPRSDIHLGSGSNWSSSNTSGEEHKGGFMHWFDSLFGSDSSERAGHYTEAAQRGNCVVGVTTDEANVDRVAEIMERYGAIDIDEQVAGYQSAGYSGASTYAGTPGVAGGEQSLSSSEGTGKDYIPVVEEELKIGKREVQRGGVRIYSRVVEEPVEENITLREEKVRVDRQKVDRPISTADAAALRDQTIEVVETAEEPVVSKTARVVEEIRVSKEAKERTTTVRDKVRRTDVQTEKLGSDGSSVNEN
jgi:uncharacterized protein (TIGR02271 family)